MNIMLNPKNNFSGDRATIVKNPFWPSGTRKMTQKCSLSYRLIFDKFWVGLAIDRHGYSNFRLWLLTWKKKIVTIIPRYCLCERVFGTTEYPCSATASLLSLRLFPLPEMKAQFLQVVLAGTKNLIAEIVEDFWFCSRKWKQCLRRCMVFKDRYF